MAWKKDKVEDKVEDIVDVSDNDKDEIDSLIAAPVVPVQKKAKGPEAEGKIVKKFTSKGVVVKVQYENGVVVDV